MKLIRDNAYTLIDFGGNKDLKGTVDKLLEDGIGVKEEGYQYAKAYQMGLWNGITKVHEEVPEGIRFPAGLTGRVDELLGGLQNRVTFQYEIIDDRPDPFMSVSEMGKNIKVYGDGGTQLTLRDYQYDAVRNVIERRTGVLHMATNCVSIETPIQTSNGYQTIRELFKDNGIPETTEPGIIKNTMGLKVVNRYGELEEPSHLTVNGVKHTNKLTTELGLAVTATDNHPMLTVDATGELVWKETKDLVVGDWLVARKGDEVYGTNSTIKITEEAYALGVLTAEENQSRDNGIPRTVREAPKTIQIAFLAGYLGVRTPVEVGRLGIRVMSTSEKLLSQIQLLLLNMGVVGSLSESATTKSKESWYGGYVLSPSESDKLMNVFKFNAKQERKDNPEPTHSLETLVDGSYVYDRIRSIEGMGAIPTYDLHIPGTHSFIANGLVNHNSGKTLTSAGIMQQLQPKLMAGERIVFFTHSKAIFNQTHKNLEQALGMHIGRYGSGKKDLRDITVAMVPTVYAALKSDPEKGLKLTAKEGVIKKMAKDIAPQFLKGANQRFMMRAYIQNFPIKTKADAALVKEIQKVVDQSESDSKAKFNLNQYAVQYNKILRTKNEKVYKKLKDIEEFLDSVAVMIYDECHRTKGDAFYYTALACKNAMYRVGMTGSIDQKDALMVTRLQAIYGDIISRVTNDEMIGRGVSAKPQIVMVPITKVTENGQELDVTKEPDYMVAYETAIVLNEYRNVLIAKLAEMCYNKGNGVLIILNRIEHGRLISDLLDSLQVPHAYVKGDVEDSDREDHFQAMRDGKLKVMIATSLIDEGVDISGIDSLIMAGAGKSLRQTLQRVGRALRKKKTGENKVVIYDTIDRTNDFLFKHSKERMSIYNEEKFDMKILE